MIQLEQRLQQRFPHWFRGRRAAIARPLLRGIERWSQLDVIDAFLAANRRVRGFAFVAAALQFLGARYTVDAAALARIPASGRLLTVANHPSGAPGSAPAAPVRIQARNSALFYGASALFTPAGTALLAREMFARRARGISLRVGSVRKVPTDVDGDALLRDIRRELYALGTRRERAMPAIDAGPEPIADAVDPAVVRAGIDAMRSLGATSDGKQIRVGMLAADAPLQRDGLVYANDGDWVESLSALVEEADGSLNLLVHGGEVLAGIPSRLRLLADALLPRAA